MRLLQKLWNDQGGNTAIMFGLAVIPILALSGGAVDFSHRADVRMEMQSAADTAALAAARVVQSRQLERAEDWAAVKAEAEAAARQVFHAQLSGLSQSVSPEPVLVFGEDGTVEVSTHAEVPTSFLTLIGISELGAAGRAEVKLPPPLRVEIALALDYSLSMLDNSKYIRMRDAAKSFIAKVQESRGERTKIGIVPFSDYVYATVRAGDIRGTETGQANQPIAACLMNRDYPYAATDEAPFSGTDASRWPQADPASAQCQRYQTRNLAARDLSSDFSSLREALTEMEPVGWTNIALAAEMGWHMLSPNDPFTSAGNYSDTQLKKVLILLTDGVQTVNAMGPDGSVSTQAADETTAEACTGAKAAGIQVYTIAYDIEEDRVRTLLSDCASGTEAYYEPEEAGDISAVFESIFLQIAESMWISQ